MIASPAAVGGFLPIAEFPSAPAGAPVSVRSSGRESTVHVRVHSAGCLDCRRYLGELVRAAPDFADWGGRVVVIVPGSVADATDLRAALSLPFTVVSETPGTHLLDRAGVIIADRFGQIFAVDDAGTEHALPPPREVEEWLKFIGTQCPE